MPEVTPADPAATLLGVCYYPEHWPETMWADDAARMVAMGLTRVRIGEFAWSRIEPAAGRFDWGWLDRAIEILHAAGLGIILGTPTATPPKWLVDTMPDMIPRDADGRPRRFGSRRHYCFSHPGYRREAARITRELTNRYGMHAGIVGWQTDNEYGCHDSVLSFSDAARDGFRYWLSVKYGDVAALNGAWGNVFWSMELSDFAAVELPNLTVTEANPAHWLDFRRYSSDQVVAFNRMQVDIIRPASPRRDIMHNFMGFFTQFDHHAVGRDIDVVGWDSYPLGFLEQFWFSDADKYAYRQQGHPDIAAFHHDLYRGCSGARWAVLEQQPGPVNWARFNPAPLPGMVRLWTLEAAAHGAELISYFRWRQVPFAQEQMHAGLLRSDNVEAAAAPEVRAAGADLATIGLVGAADKHVAMLFAYDAAWITDIQPQGAGFSALRQAFEMYTALRSCGLNVDIVHPDTPFDDYPMVVIPCLPILPAGLAARLSIYGGQTLIGPRTGSKTADFQIPHSLPPGDLHTMLRLKVVRVESLNPTALLFGPPENAFTVMRWFEHVEADYPPEWSLEDGSGVRYCRGGMTYLGGCLDPPSLVAVAADIAGRAGLPVVTLPDGVRVRRAGGLVFAFNYGRADEFEAANVAQFWPNGERLAYLVGGAVIEAAGVAVWNAGQARQPSQ